MSGHSKWSQIKRQKGVTDAKRGQLFTKLGREIAVAARQGGGDPAGNVRLRIAIQRARDSSMPADNIERAIKKATGEAGAAETVYEITYEGYGPGGTAVMVQTMTDNKNRAASEIRRVFSHNNGTLGDPGCVAWIFSAKGVIAIEEADGKADDLALAAIDAGAEDVRTEGTALEVYTAPESLESVREALEKQEAPIASSEIQMIPSNIVLLDVPTAKQALRLLDKLEELEDVQKVYTNGDFPEEALAGEDA